MSTISPMLAGPMTITREVPEASFHQPAVEIFSRVRDTMKKLIDAVPRPAGAGPINRAVDLQNAVGIYSTLAWRAFRIATVDDPLDVVDYVLSPALAETLIKAAEEKGVPATITAKVRAAADEYEQLKQEYAGDHDSFAIMLASLRSSTKKKSPLDEKFRKGMFNHNRLVWGHQSQTSVNCFIVMPDSKTPDIRTATVAGSVGYHRLRPDITEIVISGRVGDRDIEKPNDRTVSHGFLAKYCTPGVTVTATPDDNGFVHRIELPDVGRQGAIDYFQLFTSNVRIPESDYRMLNCDMTSLPAMLHQDIMIPACSEPRKFFAKVLGNNGEVFGQWLDGHILPIEMTPEYLGSSADVPAAKGVPGYTEMIRSVLKRFGWYGQAFDVYRNRLSYPIMRTRVSLIVGPPEHYEQ